MICNQKMASSRHRPRETERNEESPEFDLKSIVIVDSFGYYIVLEENMRWRTGLVNPLVKYDSRAVRERAVIARSRTFRRMPRGAAACQLGIEERFGVLINWN
jgi:hypothetical protein